MMGREEERRGEEERTRRGREVRTKQTTIRPPQSFFFSFFLNDMPEKGGKRMNEPQRNKEEDFIYLEAQLKIRERRRRRRRKA